MDVQSYLKRIEYPYHIAPDLITLQRLQAAHLLTVPFENLDIGLKRQIQLDEQSLWRKIIISQRGGFCYELNGLFARLLKHIGFDVTYLNARVFDEQEEMGIEFDHLALLIKISNTSGRWLVDVGFGDTFTQPLDLDNPDWQEQGLRAYRIDPYREGYLLWQRGYEGKVKRHYYFDLTPHRFPAEYVAACNYHQTSPDSIFTSNRIISRLTENGRVSLDNDRLIVTIRGQRTEYPVQDEVEYRALLKKHFDVSV